MNVRLINRDWKLITSYFDQRLSDADKAKIETRRQQDPQFSQSLEEIIYVRRLLASLPQKRAPRNFTLAHAGVKAPRRALWLQPALSFVSIAAMLALVAVFSFNYLGAGTAPQAKQPQPAMMAAESNNAEPHAPMIINWNGAYSMGGGDSRTAAYSQADGIGGAGGPGFSLSQPGAGGGGPLESSELSPLVIEEPAIETLPELAAEAFIDEFAAASDLSTLILGLPNREDAGSIIRTIPTADLDQEPSIPTSPVNTQLMVITGVIAVLAGAGAFFLRKQSNASSR